MSNADIIVIGAGIAGTSAAAQLAERASVIVLEQEQHPGYHSTGRSAATWAPQYGPSVIRDLTRLSGPSLKSPPAILSDRPFTSPRGEMVVGGNNEQQQLQEFIELGMQPLSIAQARKIVPLLKTDTAGTILYTDELVGIDVNSLHQAFISRLKKLNGKLLCNAAVTAIEYNDHSWNLNTTHGQFRAPVIVNAAGAWADDIATLANVRPLGLQPKRRSAALVPFCEGANMQNWPLLFNAAENFYCIPFGSALLVSPADATPVEPHDAWPSDIDLATGIERFQQVVDYDVPRVSHSWAGLRTFAPDGAPVVGFDSQAAGFFWLAGQGGYGIQTSPAMAMLCRELITGEPIAELANDIKQLSAALSPDRF